MKKRIYVVFMLLASSILFFSCEKDDNTPAVLPPEVHFDMPDDSLLVARCGEEILIRAKVRNIEYAQNIEFTWNINNEVAGHDSTLLFSKEEEGEYRVSLKVKNEKGEGSDEIKVKVRKKVLPAINLEQDEYSMLQEDTLVLKPRIRNASWSDISWEVNGVVSKGDSVFKFIPKEKGDFTINLTAVNIDGETKKEIKVETYNYADGTFFVLEGGVQYGTGGELCFLDKKGRYFPGIYRKANQIYVGNVLQDMAIYEKKIYLVTQNGSFGGGDGNIVIASAETMKKQKVFKYATNVWLQHIVVINGNKAYVQLTEDSEVNSGIKVLNPENGELSGYIDGTYGKFNSQGASKMRMLYLNGKVFAACGHELVVINTATDKVEKRISIENTSQIKGVLKGADGNIWMPVAGKYNIEPYYPEYPEMGGTAVFSTPDIIARINPSNYSLETFTLDLTDHFGVNPSCFSNGMCASFTENALFFWTGDPVNGPRPTICRFDFNTGKAQELIKDKKKAFYGYTGVDPVENKLYAGTRSKETQIFVYDPKNGASIDITSQVGDQDGDGKPENYYWYKEAAFPAGVYFTEYFKR